jgi:hypothetical protein
MVMRTRAQACHFFVRIAFSKMDMQRSRKPLHAAPADARMGAADGFLKLAV